jgi:hypothetical protein
MKLLYPRQTFTSFILSIVKTVLVIIFLVAGFYSVTNAQEFNFKKGVLVSGVEGQDGAVYRFSSVSSGIDGLIKINGRSSSMVSLVTIDLTNSGFDKAFQPQVTYGNNTSPAGTTDWWMEFQVSFVQANTNVPAVLTSFDVSGLDIDGNNDKISEYASFYGLQSFLLEKNSALKVTTITQKDDGNEGKDKDQKIGERFDGPVTNYTNVDTLATTVMVTNTFLATNSFRMRTGAKSTGVSGAANRMYSFWFKSFFFQAPITTLLPVTLINWNATFANSTVSLKWTTTVERNASHFIIERSFDGSEYSDIAMLFAAGNSEINIDYAYADKVPAGNSGTIYYRLKMVDLDGRSKTSDIRVVRIGTTGSDVKILAYPNPVVNDVRVTIPQNWQGKQVSYQLTNANGQVIKSYTVQNANQTEVIAMSQVPAGMYVVRVVKAGETAVQPIVKSAK